MAPVPKPVPPPGDPQLNRVLAVLINAIVVFDGIVAICLMMNGNVALAAGAKATSVVLQVIVNLVRGRQIS